MKNGEATNFDAEAAKFLERDFNQCFMQLRHYDSQIWNICRFAFIAYIVILGTAVSMYQYSLNKDFDLMPAAMSILGAGFVLGLLIYCLAIRTRVYYVVVCRYINEHRKLFLEAKPLGFENSSGMYVNPTAPAYFNWRSWQSLFLLHHRVAQCATARVAGLILFGRGLGIDRNCRDNHRPSPNRGWHRLPEIPRRQRR